MTNTAPSIDTNSEVYRTYFEQGRALGYDHGESHDYAESKIRSMLARFNQVQDLTVKVYGHEYTIPGGYLVQIRAERERAAALHRAGNIPAEVASRTTLRNDVMQRFDVSADRASLILAAIRQAPHADWKPEQLDLAVRWARGGWRLYQVTGTRHAYYLIRKLAQRDGFQGARLNTPLVRSDLYITDNVISLDTDDVTGSDRFGKYRALLDRSNTHYDLAR